MQLTTAVPRLAIAVVLALSAAPSRAQMAMPAPTEVIFVCPFDASIRALAPGTCTQNGEQEELVAQVPEPRAFRLSVATTPALMLPGQPARVRFEIRDPWRDKPVEKFTIVHEKPFHAFIVSEDLEFFLHDHPTWTHDGFELDVTPPKPGLYRVLTDFLPEAATPQLIASSLFVKGSPSGVRTLTRDYAAKSGANLEVALTSEPPAPIAGTTTMLRFALSPDNGIEPYLGALGHMLVASDDLVDLMHVHPVTMQVAPIVDFAVVFPRARVYRVWVQFQRSGTVNTVHFDVPVGVAP